MKLRHKIITIPTVIAVLAVLAIYHNSPVDTVGRRDSNYVLSVTWNPPVMPKIEPTLITVSVDGFPLPAWKRSLSPWSHTMTAAPDVVVTLVGMNLNLSITDIDCMIMKDGKVHMPKGAMKIHRAGEVVCVS